MILDDMTDYLSSGGLGTPGTDIFAGFAPEKPDLATIVYETGGQAPAYAMGNVPGIVSMEHPRIQVVCRATQHDYAVARVNAYNAFKLLSGLPMRVINGVQYHWGAAVQSPFMMGRDESGRVLIACNYDISKALDGGLPPSVVVSPSVYSLLVDFGGDMFAFVRPLVADAYLAGATQDTLVPDSSTTQADISALGGTYVLEATARVEAVGARAKVALFNLDDASNVALAGSEILFSADQTVGERKRSGTVSFPAIGNTKTYGVKMSSNSVAIGPAAWGCRLLRVS